MSEENTLKQARVFGTVLSTVVLALGFILILRDLAVWATITTALSIIGFFVTLRYPRFLLKPLKVWLDLGSLIHRITNPIVLVLIFFVILTPFSLISRFFRRNHPYPHSFCGSSSWQSVSNTRRGIETFRDQF